MGARGARAGISEERAGTAGAGQGGGEGADGAGQERKEGDGKG